MIAFAQFIVFGVLVLTGVYFLVSIYSRSVERERLEKEWDADHPDGGSEAGRDAYIEQGMDDYAHSLRRKLIWLVYIVPAVAVAALFYAMNVD